jgi:hypothetical protein
MIAGLPTRAFGDKAATFEPCDLFIVISALYDETEQPERLAYRLATECENEAPDKSERMKIDGCAISVSNTNVGLAVPRTIRRAGQRINCLHHNITTLLAIIQNLATLTPADVTEPARWFQLRAARVLNYVARRAELPDTKTIYKSRVGERWIHERALGAAINALTATDDPRPPDLPT